MVCNRKSNCETIIITFSAYEYNTLLNEIDENIPMDKVLSYWKILSLLEKDKKIINQN